MANVTPYEHRGAQYRAMTIQSQTDATHVASCYIAERDIWLKKILATKLVNAAVHFEIAISINELKEAMQCRIK
jgi:hypothetical protein